MVCQECGINTALMGGHSPVCPHHNGQPIDSDELFRLRQVDSESADKIRAFGDAMNDAVVERGEMSVLNYLNAIGINEGDTGYEELLGIARICLTLGAGVTIQVMVEQNILDREGLLRAAGV